MEKELTAKQRKNRKKKEAAKRKKQEQKLQVSLLGYTSKDVQNLLNKWCLSSHTFQESVKVSAENTLESDGDKTQDDSQVKRFELSSNNFLHQSTFTPDILSCVIFFFT